MGQTEPFQKRNFKTMNLPGQLLYVLLIFQAGIIVVLIEFRSYSNLGYTLKVTLVLLSALVLVLVNYLLYQKQHWLEKREFERETFNLQLRHSYRLLDTVASIHRETRNHLQVINSLVTLDKTKIISTFIFNFAEEMKSVAFTGIENPALASVILHQKIIAWEKGIGMLINSNTTLCNLKSGLDELEQVVNQSLELFVANEIDSRSVSKFILMDIKETGEAYYFEFNNSEEAVLNFLSRKRQNYRSALSLGNKEEGVERFKPVIRLIKKLTNRYEQVIKGGVVIQLKIWVRK